MHHSRTVPGTFGELLWESFRATSGPVLSTLGLLAALVTWIFSRDTRLSIVWLVASLMIAAILIFTLVHAALVTYRAVGKHLPAVKLISKPPPSYRDVVAVILLEPSDLFALDSLVSIYQLQDQQYEVLVGLGRVLTVQENGLVQVGIQRILEHDSGLMDRLLQNDARVLTSILVKPSVPRYELFTGSQS